MKTYPKQNRSLSRTRLSIKDEEKYNLDLFASIVLQNKKKSKADRKHNQQYSLVV